MTEKNLWVEVGNECLKQALELLKSKTASSAGTAETVKTFVNLAIAIDIRDSRVNAACKAVESGGTRFVKMEKSKVYRYLEKEVTDALSVKSNECAYAEHGAIKMAYELELITFDEFLNLGKKLGVSMPLNLPTKKSARKGFTSK